MNPRAISVMAGLFLIAGGCVSNRSSPVEALLSTLARNNPDSFEYNNPKVVTYRGRPEAWAEYPHFTVLAPAAGKWKCLYGMQHMVLFTRESASRSPGMSLMAASSRLRELEINGLPTLTNIQSQAQLSLLVETMISNCVDDLSGPASARGTPKGSASATGPKPAMIDSTQLPKDLRTQPFRVRSKELMSDLRFADTGVRYRLVVQGERNPSQLVVNEGFCYVPRKDKERLILVSTMWWGGEADAALADTEAIRFLDSFKPKR
jgi:hypothetical protein